MSCLLGDVKDLSSTGMRVAARQAPPIPPGVLFEFELNGPSESLTLVGRIVRVEKCKAGAFEIGVEFQRLTPELVAAVDSLARHGVIKGRKPTGRPAGVTVRMEVPNLYAMLGVEPSASDDQIQRAFREMARKYHPDLNKSAEAQTRFVELHKAYDLLKDADKRRAYDAARAA
jgi:hypothetical protein